MREVLKINRPITQKKENVILSPLSPFPSGREVITPPPLTGEAGWG